MKSLERRGEIYKLPFRVRFLRLPFLLLHAFAIVALCLWQPPPATCQTTVQEEIEAVIAELQQVVNDNPNTPFADKLEDAIAKLQTAIIDLNKTPRDNQAAAGNLEGAVGDLLAAFNEGLLEDPQLMDQLAGVARRMAVNTINWAIDEEGDTTVISDAQQFLQQGDQFRASGAFKDAVAKYKDALAKAASVLPTDITPPTITATVSPQANAAGWRNTDVSVTFNCTDDLSGIESCTGPITVSTEGAGQVIKGTAIDRAGNSSATTVTISLDKTVPSVAIASPADGSTADTQTVTISGTITDALSGVTSATCGGSPVTLTGSNFSCDVSLAAGSNSVVVTATDAAGNVGSAAITVVFAADSDPPSLLILRPLAGSFVFVSRPEIELSFSDASGVNTTSLALTANNQPLAAECELTGAGGKCTPTTAIPDGPVVLAASVADPFGNTGSTSVQFTVDTLPVEVAIATPSDGLITKDAEVEVRGTVGTDVISVQVNGIAAPLAGTSFTVIVPLREGKNMLVALATKFNGKTGTASVEATRDIVAPIVRIDSPRDGFVSVTNVITVTGLVNDIVNGATNPVVRVNGVEATVAGGAFMVMDVPLVPGPNTIEAVARDAVGNEGRHQITVNFQLPVGARIGILSGNGQGGIVNQTLSQPLVAVVKDDFGNPVAGRVVTFEVTRNSGALKLNDGDSPQRVLQVATDGTGRASARLTLGDTAGEGNNRVRAAALGVAGEVEFCASALAAAPDKILMVQGDNQRGVIGHPLASPLEALVVDKDGNPIASVDVSFAVVQGNGSLDGQQSLVQVTGTDGIARAVLTLGPEPGINNNVVSASFQDLQGLPATFVASGLLPGNPAATRFSGVVLDNGHTPIPGAVVSIPDTPVSAVTDAEGQFLLENVPVGHIHLRIDPTNSPRPETFPPLEFETVTVAGQINVLGQPILLPPLDTEGSKIVGGVSDVKLTMNGVAGLELTVFANSVTCPEGTPDRSPDGKQCRVSISQVHLDKVPMPPPNGGLFTPPAWTIQPAGVHFDPPARICVPNCGLPPGRVTDVFQFDHALNQFISVGKGTVAEDGSVICTDPGFGITAAGWGGAAPNPNPPTCGSGCEPCGRCDPGINRCVPKPSANGAPCENDPCIVNGRCENGACTGDKKEITKIDAKADGKTRLVKALNDQNQAVVEFTAVVEQKNCTKLEFKWDFGDGKTSNDQNPTHTYTPPNEYKVTLSVRCDECSESSKTAALEVTVAKIDLQLQGLPDENQAPPNEENPGAFIPLNNDDDNDNLMEDRNESGSVAQENELIPLTILFQPAEMASGTVQLEPTAGADKIRMWADASRTIPVSLPQQWVPNMVPTTLYIEGVLSSSVARDAGIRITFTKETETVGDRVLLTVVGVEIERQTISQLRATGSPLPIGTPAYGWRDLGLDGPNPPTVDFAAGNNSQTHPNTAELMAPPNPDPLGSPQPGGLSRMTVTYTTAEGGSASNFVKQPAFGVSCYNTPDEPEFIDANGQCTCIRIAGTEFCGTTTDTNGLTGTFCRSFLASVRLNGNGRTRAGALIQIDRLGPTLETTTFRVVPQITGADGTPVVADGTIARDRNIIPRGGVRVNLEGIGEGLLANDTGGDILGYRVDLYRGFGEAACQNWPNPIVLGACTPANPRCP